MGRCGLLTMLPRAPASSTHVRVSRVPRATASAWVPLVQYHLKDGAAAGGEQLAGHEQFGHLALAGGLGHPPLGPVVAAQPVAPGGPFLVAARAGHDDDEFRIEPREPGTGEPPAPGAFGMTVRIPKPSAMKDAHAEGE